MRVGEIQKKLSSILNSSNQVVMDSIAIYGGQAYTIRNYGLIVDALEILAPQPWNTIDFNPVKSVIDEHGHARSAQLSVEEYTILETYISSLNQLLPIYVGVIESLTEEQDSQVINVMLPDSIQTLAELATMNDKINDVFKLFKEDGEIVFEGFDKGTDWLILLLSGEITFPLFLGCLDAARKYCEVRESWYKSEKARIDYEAAAAAFEQKITEPSFEKYQENHLNNQLTSDVKKVLANLELNGRTKPERENKILAATKGLIEAMGEGVEFHLSLNPPEYATETQGNLEINYKKLQALREPKEKTKNLPEGKIKPNSDQPPAK